MKTFCGKKSLKVAGNESDSVSSDRYDATMQNGALTAIWIKRFKLGPMDPANEARLVAGSGLVGNANQGGKRQVTIIEEEKWKQMMEETGGDLSPSSRRANLMVRGIDLTASREKILTIGEVRIRIYGETRPCERMEEALPGLREAMKPDWRGGAYGEVLNDGAIQVGDVVTLV